MNIKKKSKQKVQGINNYVKVLVVCVVFVFVLFLVSVSLLFLKQSLILDRTEVNVTMGVSDYVGLNKDTDKLHLGTSFPGGRMNAYMNVSSPREGYLYISCNGGNEVEISNWLFVSKQGAEVFENKIINLTFEGRPSKEAEYGKYESTLYFYVLKNKDPSFFERLFVKGDFLKTMDFIPPASDGGLGGKILISIAEPNITLENISE